MSYDNTNRGAIWGNQRKEKDTHPDFTGSINVEGVEYFLDAWKRKPDASENAPSLSFRVKRKDSQPNEGGGGESPPDGGSNPPDLEDEIPFVTPWPVRGVDG